MKKSSLVGLKMPNEIMFLEGQNLFVLDKKIKLETKLYYFSTIVYINIIQTIFF